MKQALQNKKWELPEILRKLLFGWIVAVCIEYFLVEETGKLLDKTGGQGLMSLERLLLVTVGITALLTVMSLFLETEKWEKWGIFTGVAVLLTAGIAISGTPIFCIACGLVLLLLLVYCLKGWNGETELSLQEQKCRKSTYVFLGVLCVGFFIFGCVWMVAKTLTFQSYTYDMGIFSQMFYSMKETGLPITTLERDKVLSHFAVHVSPIYYLMLPFYCLVPHPAALQVLQVLVLISAVIPLWKLGTHHGLSGWQRLLLCALLLLYPAFFGGIAFDLHENCFLTPLILWLFYAVEKRNWPGITLSALLTLCVKEDAAVYVAVIALFLLVKTLLQKEKDKTRFFAGLGLLMGSVLCFLLTTWYLGGQGDGVMVERYYNCMYNGNVSLMAVIRCAIVHPMKVLFECADRTKLKYIVLTMAPLMGLPVLTRRYERFILLIPYILINLVSDYVYQSDVFFQYSFGSIAFSMYLTVLNLKELPWEKWKTPLLTAGTVVAAVAFALVIIPEAIKYPGTYLEEREANREVCEMLSQIPEDAVVTATEDYTVHLSQREKIYDLCYASTDHILESEYIVLTFELKSLYSKFSPAEGVDGRQALIDFLEEQGYEQIAIVENKASVYKRSK